MDLARAVVKTIDEGKADFRVLYPDNLNLLKKIEVVAKEIYRANEVIVDQKIKNQLIDFEKDGFGHLPVCMAKTQYSFSTDPALKGSPTGYNVPIREVRISSGAEFILVVCGAIMTMPGLPRVPAAEAIELDKNGLVQGLF